MEIRSEQGQLPYQETPEHTAASVATTAAPMPGEKARGEPPALLLGLIGLSVVTVILAALAFWLGGSVRRLEALVAQQQTALATVQTQMADDATRVAETQAATQAAAQMAEARLAEEQRRSAAYSRIVRANQLANNALLELDDRPQAALLLAIESLRMLRENGEAPLPESVQRLRAILGATGGTPLPAETETTALAVSADGRWLAAGGETGVVRTWDLQQLTTLPRLHTGHTGPVFDLAFAPQGATLYSTGEDGTLRRWDLAEAANGTGKAMTATTAPLPPLYVIATAPDGSAVAAAGEEGTVLLWREGMYDRPLTLRGHTGVVNAVAFSPDGRLLASAGSDGAVRFWASQDGEQQAVMPPAGDSAQDNFIHTIVFSPDGHWLASGSNSGQVRLWRVPDALGPEQDEVDATVTSIPLLGHRLGVYVLSFAPDGRFLASGSEDGEVRLWNVAQPDDSVLLGRHGANVRGLAFAEGEQGPILVSSGYDGQVRIWDYRAPEAEATIVRGHDNAINQLAQPATGAAAADLLVTAGYDGSLRIWNTRRPFAEPHQVLTAGAAVLDVAISSDGAQIAAFAEGEPTIEIWDTQTGAMRLALAQGAADIRAIAYAPAGNLLWAGGSDGTISLWDTRAGTLLRRFQASDQVVLTVAPSPDGRLLAGSGEDGVIRLWAADRGDLLHELRGESGTITGLAFTADGKTLVSSGGDSGMLRLWNVASGKMLEALQGPSEGLLDVAVQPDGPWLVGAGRDGAVWVWNADALAFEPARLQRHDTEVNAVNFSADGQILASAGADGAVYLWSTVTPSAEPDALTSRAASANGVSFAPEGTWVASGSADGAIQRWSLSLDDLIAEACRTAGRNFTLEEWTQYFPTDVSSYRKTCPNLPGPQQEPAAAGPVP